MLGIVVAATVTIPLGVASAYGQITHEPAAPLPDPRKFARGWFIEAEMGAFAPLGEAKPLGVGVGVGARLGYDLARFVALALHAFGSTHKTDFGSAPQSGQLLQLYQLVSELKLTVPLRQVSVFAVGGAGLASASTNLLGTTELSARDDTTGLMFLGGLGLDYHPLARHFSFGARASFCRLQTLRAPGGITATSYVRFTF